ncbi:hypothetical protein QE152_g36805 [Popillia japonica]|uniref:Xylose isomerase n=1 Tax=Popillia japonica TaxID=7064 RepID=A0AAW1ICE9_POPJA
MFATGNIKRQKTREQTRSLDNDNFPAMGRIDYKPDASYSHHEDNFYYRYYNSNERLHGRTMEDWMRPSIFLGKAFTPYPGCSPRPWSENPITLYNMQNMHSLENYKRGVRAMFELCMKMGIKYWSGYDRDLAPEGETSEETQYNYEQVVDLIQEYQQKSGIRPLWIGIDFKNTYKFRNGAVTNPESSIVTYAGYQTKRALDIANKLGAENVMFSASQEGYFNIMNTDITRELKNFHKFLKLMIEHKDRIGYRGQLLMQTAYDNRKAFRDEGYKYCYDFPSTLCFLKHYNFERQFKLVVKPGHFSYMANMYGCLGSIDIKHKNLYDVQKAAMTMKMIVENGGISPGGLTFYVPHHKSTFDAKDLAEAFITAVDTYAKALRIAVKFINDIQLNKSIQMRYVSFSSGWGSKFNSSEANLDDCDDQIRKQEPNIMQPPPSRSEHWYAVLTRNMETPFK